jgi:hypothetical protein
MHNTFKLLGIIALAVIIGFALAGCPNGDDGDDVIISGGAKPGGDGYNGTGGDTGDTGDTGTGGDDDEEDDDEEDDEDDV